MKRRRFLTLSGSAIAGLSVASLPAVTSGPAGTTSTVTTQTLLKPVQARAFALGAEGSFSLFSNDPAKANEDLKQCFREIGRLEKVFSLYHPRSEISELNALGILKNPSPDWKTILDVATAVHKDTEGLFDPTIQPYWIRQIENGIVDSALLSRIGWSKVEHDAKKIAFTEKGVQLSLNGIAQGYITDRMTTLLHEMGYEHALIQVGESRSLGKHPDGRPWNLAIPSTIVPKTSMQTVSIADGQAIATSGIGETVDGKPHHFLPENGSTQTCWTNVSVMAPRAIIADAYSTALLFASHQQIKRIGKLRPALKIVYS